MADTGPNYPRGPLPGSNGIGIFTIGISPIGTIPGFDYWRTVISQYANSPILTTLIGNIFDYLDQTGNFDAFFDLVMNVDTAQGYGLDLWGRIVNVNRTLQVPAGSWLGFNEALPGSFGFGQEPFYAGTTLTNNYVLTDPAYRTLILVKAAANITDGSIPSINRFLMTLFPNRGNAYVTDGQPIGDYFGFEESGNAIGFNQSSFYDGETIRTMSMEYVFTFELAPYELAIVQQSGALPKPTGISASVQILVP